ncbi:MAG: acyl-CoA synthetase [Chloroflexi bacterium]|nr:acyl-CoA synthetase [Chloroflexota bacterium]
MNSEKVYRTELTPLSFLWRTARLLPEKTAIVHGDRRYNYHQFEERVNRLASGLLAVGLQKGDRVAFLCPNIPPMLEGHFAVPAAGGILVSINTRLNANEISYILGHSGARFLFVDAELQGLAAAAQELNIEVIRIDDTGEAGDPYEDFLAKGSPARLGTLPLDEEDTISINYTSGTTGKPKGVMSTHRGAYLNSLGEIIETGMNVDSVYLWTLPMFHCDGWSFTWATSAVAATNVCLRKLDPARIWELLESEGVTHYCGAPTVQISLVNHPAARRLDRQVTVTVAGSPPSPTLIGQLKELNFRPIHVYGLTETYGPITICEWHPEWNELPLEDQSLLLARQGQSYVVADEIRVVDEQMQDVPKDRQTIGEVIMHGNNVMKGYFDNPEATKEAFRGGWFHSGDLAVVHPDGYIELRDRKKDIIISGGENISTIEVEQTIAKHPAVLECAVVAIPDEKWGERPKGFVTLKPGQNLTEKELIDFCRQNLAHFKCPAAIEFGELPKTSTGKIQKFVLRQKEWSGRDKLVN